MSGDLIIEAIKKRPQWSIQERSYKVLTAMICRAHDLDGAEHYCGGHESLAGMLGLDEHDPRTPAAARQALNDLTEAGLIEPLEIDGDAYAYRITL
jgi:hypothetical protein